MNAQEAFDTAVAGVIKQGRPSVDEYNFCVYRGPDGLRCAVGWLIPDELYVPEMENRDVGGLAEGWPELDEIVGDNTILLIELQDAHDACRLTGRDFVDEFKRRARRVAEHHSLDPRVAE